VVNYPKMGRFAFRMARKSIGRRKFRAALTILGIVIGIATIVSLISLGDGMRYEIETTLNDILGAGIVISDESHGVTVPEHVREYVLNIPGVENCVPTIQTFSQIGDARIVIIGIDPEQAVNLYQITLSAGRIPNEDEAFMAVLGETTAKRLGLDLGDTITLSSIVGGIGETFEVVGIIESIGSGGFDVGCFISLQDAQHLVNKEGYVSSLMVTFEDPEQADYIQNILENLFPDAEIQTQEAVLGQIGEIMNIVNGVLLALGSVSLVVGAIGVMNTITMSVYERTREIGMMKAVGGERWHVLILFLSESAIIGLIGGCIGIIMGIIFVYGIQHLVLTFGLQFTIPIIISPQTVLAALGISSIIAVIAGFYPSWNAANIRPVEALRYE